MDEIQVEEWKTSFIKVEGRHPPRPARTIRDNDGEDFGPGQIKFSRL